MGSSTSSTNAPVGTTTFNERDDVLSALIAKVLVLQRFQAA